MLFRIADVSFDSAGGGRRAFPRPQLALQLTVHQRLHGSTLTCKYRHPRRSVERTAVTLCVFDCHASCFASK